MTIPPALKKEISIDVLYNDSMKVLRVLPVTVDSLPYVPI